MWAHLAGQWPEAFAFVQQGLAHAVKLVHDQDEAEMIALGQEHHVSGQELCEGLRDFAVNRYGLLAKAVLAKWGVHATDDFGRIVFAMIDAGLMRRSEDDLFEHFVGVYAFADAFPAPPTVSFASGRSLSRALPPIVSSPEAATETNN